MTMSSLTRGELTREVSAPVADDDYGQHPPRAAYPGVVLPDRKSAEHLPTGSVSGYIARLEARVRELETELAAARGGQ